LRNIGDEASRNDGDVPPADIDALTRLDRLVEMRDKRLATAAPRWRIAAILAGTIVLVSLLLFLRVHETEVEMQLSVSEVGFVLSQPQVLTDLANLAEVRLSGIRGIQFFDPALSEWATQAPLEEQKGIRIAAIDRDNTLGTVTLNPLDLAGGVRVHVSESRVPTAGRIVLSGSHTAIRATLYGPVEIDLPGRGTRAPVLKIPSSLVVETQPGEVDLELAPTAGSVIEFSPQLSIKELALSRIDEFQSVDGTTAHAVSTILSGTIYLESLNGEPRALRPRELLQFDDVRGVIRTLKLEDGHVTVAFSGTVRGMRSGWGANPASLMPTWLAWLQARHALSLLWGTTLYLFGLIAAVLRWWKAPQ
jgi:hypothetical protein